jgi:hypothetical protein
LAEAAPVALSAFLFPLLNAFGSLVTGSAFCFVPSVGCTDVVVVDVVVDGTDASSGFTAGTFATRFPLLLDFLTGLLLAVAVVRATSSFAVGVDG